MRLSVKKAAHADMSRAAYRKSGAVLGPSFVREKNQKVTSSDRSAAEWRACPERSRRGSAVLSTPPRSCSKVISDPDFQTKPIPPEGVLLCSAASFGVPFVPEIFYRMYRFQGCQVGRRRILDICIQNKLRCVIGTISG